MSIIIDAILLIIIAICLLYGYLCGFVRTVIKMFSGIAAFIFAYITSPFAATFYKPVFYESIKSILNEKLLQLGASEPMGIFSENALNGFLGDLMEMCGFGLSELQAQVSQTASIEDACMSLAEKFADPIAAAVSFVTAFATTFIIAVIIVSVIASVLKLATKLPVIKQADKLLGLLMGIVSAVVFSTVYMTSVKLSIPFLSLISANIDPNILENTFLFKHLYDINLLQKLFEYVNISSSLN